MDIFSFIKTPPASLSPCYLMRVRDSVQVLLKYRTRTCRWQRFIKVGGQNVTSKPQNYRTLYEEVSRFSDKLKLNVYESVSKSFWTKS